MNEYEPYVDGWHTESVIDPDYLRYLDAQNMAGRLKKEFQQTMEYLTRAETEEHRMIHADYMSQRRAVIQKYNDDMADLAHDLLED